MSQAAQEPEPVDPDAFRQVMGRLVTGVTVVTTKAGGLDHAMTANAVMSVSLEPLLVVLSVEKEARFHDAVLESGVWGVSILPESARAAAAWLATRGRPLHGQLDRIAHHRGAVTGVALLDDALGTLECHTFDTVGAGDHSLLIGNVRSLTITERPGDALVYYRGAFGVQR
ncbi:flavin reductase family protein [Flexivirga meconopsidis]|uniref:flavin reductase family protein n=1 Tax=Flexivirga meconopsidis TaxID=2977121 RepID=UPI00223FF7CC|nr:flavin reductase family protein [Flexivirga meconopsidis]